MPETWIFIIGGIVIAFIILLISYTLISNAVNLSERQTALGEYSKLFTDIQSVCLGEVNNSIGPQKYLVPFSVKILYATNVTNETVFPFVDKIKNLETSSGSYLCLQFKDEKELRCLPEKPESMYCNVTMPYLGALPETEDIWMMVNKILGKPRIKEYYLLIKKAGPDEINISVG